MREASWIPETLDVWQHNTGLLEPVTEDWHCLVVFIKVRNMMHRNESISLMYIQAAWKSLYKKSAGDRGTVTFFKNLLNRVAVTNEPKRDVDATVDFLQTVIKGHWLACACQILGVKG